MEEKNEKMELIDFDDKFTQVLNDWVEKNQTKFANADEMEAAMPDVYLRFLNTPADWLGGKAPGNAFDDVSDAGDLVALMKRYIEEEIPVPDPLLDRIAEIADDNRTQSRAITEVSAAVGTMDQATQQNAAMVEQTSAAVRNLTSEVTALSEQAAKFRIAGTLRQGAASRQADADRQTSSRFLTAKATAMTDVSMDSGEFASF